MKRRDFLSGVLAASAVSMLPFGTSFAADSKKKILYFSNSAGFEHDPVKLRNGGPSVSDVAISKVFAADGVEIVCTKDGKIFDGDLKQYSCIAFYTSGNLLNGPNAMSREGKKRFLEAIDDGVGFCGFHSATDTWRTPGPQFESQDRDKIDPYITMLGAEFISHGAQQDSIMKVTQPAQFPWLKDKGESFKYFDEWYTLKNFNKDMHVIMAEDNTGMKGDEYNRPPFPATWARMQKKGRVAYCSMGHRNEFWEDAKMMQFIRELLGWTIGEFDIDVTPNFDKVTPDANILKR